MAKKKTATRKARQTVQATHSPYPARSSSTVSNSTSASKAASAAPSNASSPSPQLADPVQVGRRKSIPRRSPSQNDSSQGIVFSFVFQKDPAMSMSVDIRSYDQQFGPSEETQGAVGTAPTLATGEADLVAATAVTSSAASVPSPLAMSHTDNSASFVSSHASSNSANSTPGSTSASPSLRMAGEQWSSDPSAFRSSNVYDESRNLLILHTRRPAPVIAVVPPQPLSGPSTPALSQSSSTSSSASSTASSSASSPSTPSTSFQSTLATSGSCSQAAAAITGDSLCSRKSLPLDIISSQPTRYLNPAPPRPSPPASARQPATTMTMAHHATQQWEADILGLFANRDRHEKAFTNMVESYNGLVQKLSFFVDQNKHLETNAQSTKEQHDKMARQVTVLREQGSPMNQKRSAELEAQVASLKEERAELYKTQGTNAQRLLDLNDILRVKDATLAQNKEEIRRLTESNQFYAHKNQELTDLVGEKNITIQVIQDELTTLQLEMGKLDERQRDLERENAQLLQRWLKKMNEEADRMNAANVFLENEHHEAGSQPLQSPPSTRSLRSVGPESPTQSNWRGGSAIFSIIPQISSRKFTTHDAEVNTVSLSNGGSMVATGSNDKKIKIWDIKTGSLKSTLTGCLQSVMCVSFNATDELLLGASNDNAARLWHLGTGRPRHTLTGHIGKVFSARFNPDSSKVVSGSHDRTIKVWDLQKGYCIRTMFTFASVNDVCLMDFDGSTIASGHLDNNLRFWDARSGNCVKEVTGIHLGQITSVCPSADGSQILTNSRDNTLRILDVRTYETLSVLHADGYKTGTNWSKACFSPDGQYVVSGSADGTLYYWSTRDGTVEKTSKDQSSPIVGVSWVNSSVVSAEKDKTVVIWGTTARRPTVYEK